MLDGVFDLRKGACNRFSAPRCEIFWSFGVESISGASWRSVRR
jgi:hypothetical protein